MNVEMMKRLKAALAGRASVDIGHFQWINLDMVRNEVGEKWDTLREKVYTAAAHFIEKRLGPEDVMVRCKGGFILVFAERSGEQASVRTEAISQELNLFFLGDRILKHLEVSSQCQNVSMAELADMVAGGKEEAAADRAQERESRKKDDAHKRETAGNWRRLKHENEAGRVGGYTVGDGLDDALLEIPRADPADFADLAAETMGTGADLFADLGKTWDDIVFLPSWDVRFGYITTNFCMARRQYRGRTLFGRDTLLGNDSSDLHRLLDHTVAIAAQRGFLHRYAQGVKCAIAIPVNYDTIIGVSDRIRYFSILQCVPQKVRKYFYLRVDNIPEGAPQGQMEELFRAMRCFGSNILAKIPLGTVHLSRFENCGVSLFSSELPQPDGDGGLREATLKKLMSQAVSIDRFGARGCLTRVSTFDQLQAALDAGFQVFTGDAVGAPLTKPMPLQPCLLDDLRRHDSDAA